MAPGEYNLDQPWARQPFDGDLEWALFQDYLGLKSRPRSLAVLSKGGSDLGVRQLEAIADRCCWSLRAARWDTHLDTIRTQTIEEITQEDARAVAIRHGGIAKRALELADRELGKYLKASKEGDMLGLLRPLDLIRFIVLGVRTERLVMGEAIDRVESKVDLSKYSLDELRQLQELQAKVSEE